MKDIKKFTQVFEAEDQITILNTKMTEYNANKSKLVSFLGKPDQDKLFDNLLSSLKYKDNDLLRYEWAYQKAAADVKKYKELIDSTVKEYNTKKI
jgi:hypothetical protein